LSAAPNLEDLQALWADLPRLLTEQRWFSEKQRVPVAAHPAALFWVRHELPALLVVLADVAFKDGPPARYQLLFGARDLKDGAPEAPPAGAMQLVLSAPGGPAGYVLYDAMSNPILVRQLLAGIDQPPIVDPSNGSELRLRRLGAQIPEVQEGAEVHALSADQSNSSVVIGEQLLLKAFRRVWAGANPELELLETLDRAGFEAIAKPWAAVEATIAGQEHSLGVLQSYLRNGTDGFAMALTSLRDLYGDLVYDADGDVPSDERCETAVQEQGGSFLPSAVQLGRLTARMHAALASPEAGSDLGHRAATREDLEVIAAQIESHFESILSKPDQQLEPLRVHESAVRSLLARLRRMEPSGWVMRVHGDYHLGQLLRTDSGWHVLDFEGRPTEPIEVRKVPTTPLRDVAGMLRSFEYAASVALRQQTDPDGATAGTLAPFGRAWSRLMRQGFLEAYLESLGSSAMVPALAEDRLLLLYILEVGQTLYEVEYELSARPDWLGIPLEGITRLLHAAAT
jgi:trehalose synthase-fused probable maltokinase